MDGERDTRFSYDLLDRACTRLNVIKDEVGDHELELLEHLGWAPMAVAELLESILEQIVTLGNKGDLDFHGMLATAWIDGALLGALAADISYERGLGLEH